jgi:hypothetical protein
LPDTINWPKLTTSPRRRHGGLIFLIAVIAVIVLGSRTALSYWVDLLWFESLGYSDVFWKARGLQWGIFTAFAALTFLILFGIFPLSSEFTATICPAITLSSSLARR